jgi:cytoskeleton protein RodZ
MAIDIGAELKAAREAKGLSIGTLAHRIRVQPRNLAAIEQNDVSVLPPRPFGRGFVRAYAEELDLDPDRTVQNFFAQFPSAPAPAPGSAARSHSRDAFIRPPSHWTGLGTAAAILIVVVTAAVVLGRRGEPEGESNAVGTTGSSAPAAAATAAAPPATTPASGALPTPAAAPTTPLRLAFTVDRPCWVTATADGQRTLYRTLEPGEQQTLEASRQIVVRFGDAGAVKWTINGREGAPLGPSGAVRDLRITPENAATIR